MCSEFDLCYVVTLLKVVKLKCIGLRLVPVLNVIATDVSLLYKGYARCTHNIFDNMICLILIWIYLLTLEQHKVRSSPPKFIIPNENKDVFEKSVTYMRCLTLPSQCNPSDVYIEKYKNENWTDACTLHNDNTYTSGDGHDVQGRVNVTYNRMAREFIMDLSDIQLVDNGDWRCTLKNCQNKELQSQPDHLLVSTKISSDDISVTPPSFILLNSPAEYTCYSGRVYPEANVTWRQGDETSTGTPANNCVDNICEILNTKSFTFCERDNMTVTCTLEKTTGSNKWCEKKTADVVPVYAPAKLESTEISDYNPNILDALTIPCNGSGTNHSVTWKKDSKDLPDGLFTKVDEIIYGSFTCGETNATQSTLNWIQNGDWACDTVGKHDGEYQCIVNADKGTMDMSNIFKITVYYAPVLDYTTKDIETSVGNYETLPCKEKCAMPDEVSYKWISDNNPEGLGFNTSSITIEISEDDINKTYTCTVTNEVGFNSVTFTIRQEEKIMSTDQPHDTTTPDDTESTTDPEEPQSPNQALVTAFAVIWSLCGVFAILLVCLALYHYRQIQNVEGKHYKGEYSEELVLTEDEAAPGTSHGSGVYEDISPAVVGKGSMGEAVGGISNEGLYAEVQRPAQAQMPVAPKHTSKIPASQPNPGTLNTKRTQAPDAPKSPMNTHHQPNSPSTGRRPEPKADYSPVSKRQEIQPQHSTECNRGPASNTEQQQKRHESPNKTGDVKQTTNSAKPSIPFKPNITSVRSSRAPYDNAEVNLYANCDQRPVQKNANETVTYADLDLRKEDLYDEGAPPVPAKNMTDQEPVQYASIKHNK